MTQTSINYGIVLYELSVPGEAVEASRRILEEVKELSKVLESPVVPFEEKEKVISRIFPEEMKNFLCVVCKYVNSGSVLCCSSFPETTGGDQEISFEEISDAGYKDPNHKG